ncbi:UDP-N-acetylglucosamine 2-epimerase [Lysobacter sp. K5869]|uniref:UDP-N-acetylglucosamine 2-epimerase n=1 Tax=Lysobacter sp. K5869 TaxID=2820808 RepID=UPI001C05F6C2|nr:UDP-N-acetylglucosamine 2-epimerase [Lysobacter sp. K5869]QWP78645.1 UDP-N-acetylglucosamine 2-epimerase [Lysobacter sp. K5869]
MARGVVFVVGTRAQLIKVAPVIVACESRAARVRLLMTGQHKETMQDLIQEFGIRTVPEDAVELQERATVMSLLRWLPAAWLGVKRKLSGYSAEGGDWIVVVHGDTLSTLIGAAAARVTGLPCAHVESGLTSGKLLDPFPEEISRRLVFRFADLALCPDEASLEFMRRRHGARAVGTGGNTIVDAVKIVSPRVGPDLERKYLVASLHRFQNIYQQARLSELVDLLVRLSDCYEVHFVLHPATRKRLEDSALRAKLEAAPGIRLSPRLGYGAFLRLVAGASCVLTDGGSNQEELAVLGVPTLIMRAHTERSDGLGQNACMEGAAPGGVFEFIRSGAYQQLRQAPAVDQGRSPSAVIAEQLLA